MNCHVGQERDSWRDREEAEPSAEVSAPTTIRNNVSIARSALTCQNVTGSGVRVSRQFQGVGTYKFCKTRCFPGFSPCHFAIQDFHVPPSGAVFAFDNQRGAGVAKNKMAVAVAKIQMAAANFRVDD